LIFQKWFLYLLHHLNRKIKMEPSSYQIAVYDAVQNGKSDILVKATAGSGKTTTIVNASKLIPASLDVIFLAFNKSIVNELKERLPETVKCSTLHSLGFQSLYKYYKTNKGIKVDNYKTSKFSREAIKYIKGISHKDQEKALWVVDDIIDKARLNHIENTYKALTEVADYYGISYENKEIELVQSTYDMLKKYNDLKFSEEKLIDFTDMIYIPSIYDVQLPKFDVVFVDEAQDLNKSQQILVEKIKKPSGRAIYVGDENQAIYMFAGADASSFNSIAKNNTVKLPLSVCYRCGKNIIKEAQNIIGEDNIKPFEGQQDGLVTYGTWEDIKEGDLVVCRNNAPLFSLYFDLLSKGIKASIKGREIEGQLLKLVHKIRYSTVEQGAEKLDQMLEKIEEEQRKKGKKEPEKTKRYQNFSEMSRIIKFLSQDKEMMSEVKLELEGIFNDEKKGASLMTIHKSKGLEAERVHFLMPELIPSRWAETDEEIQQEYNLKFVAVTRAKKHLNYIKGYENRIDL
jgi:DNA helicase-2/ATP-dependent DNA helicase PcrA